MKVYFISGFPGIGKSTFTDLHPEVADSDSSQFPKHDFPRNYLAFIRDQAIDGKCALISTHKPVRDGLTAMGLAYVLIQPSLECKDEYIQRYKDRGSPDAFITLLTNQWEAWVNECRAHTGYRIELKPGQYLSDVAKFEPATGHFHLTGKVIDGGKPAEMNFNDWASAAHG